MKYIRVSHSTSYHYAMIVVSQCDYDSRWEPRYRNNATIVPYHRTVPQFHRMATVYIFNIRTTKPYDAIRYTVVRYDGTMVHDGTVVRYDTIRYMVRYDGTVQWCDTVRRYDDMV